MPNVPVVSKKDIPDYRNNEKNRMLMNRFCCVGGASLACIGFLITMIGISLLAKTMNDELNVDLDDGESWYTFAFDTDTDFSSDFFTTGWAQVGDPFEKDINTLLAGFLLTAIGILIVCCAGLKQSCESIYYNCSDYQQRVRKAAIRQENMQLMHDYVTTFIHDTDCEIVSKNQGRMTPHTGQTEVNTKVDEYTPLLNNSV